jgi:hypothetical protein
VFLRLEATIPLFLHQDFGGFLSCLLLVMLNVFAEADDLSNPRLRVRLSHQAFWSLCTAVALSAILQCRLLCFAGPQNWKGEVLVALAYEFCETAGWVWCAVFLFRMTAILAEHICHTCLTKSSEGKETSERPNGHVGSDPQNSESQRRLTAE